MSVYRCIADPDTFGFWKTTCGKSYLFGTELVIRNSSSWQIMRKRNFNGSSLGKKIGQNAVPLE
jgi:hypothetical protein